jgi:hypothetical protein
MRNDVAFPGKRILQEAKEATERCRWKKLAVGLTNLFASETKEDYPDMTRPFGAEHVRKSGSGLQLLQHREGETA